MVMLTFEPVLKKAEEQEGGGAELACALVCAKIGVRVAHLKRGCAHSTGKCPKRSTACSSTTFQICCSVLAKPQWITWLLKGSPTASTWWAT